MFHEKKIENNLPELLESEQFTVMNNTDDSAQLTIEKNIKKRDVPGGHNEGKFRFGFSFKFRIEPFLPHFHATTVFTQ